MKIIGFNLSKIDANRSNDFKKSSINTNIEFTNVEKEKFDFMKDTNVLKTSFKFSVSYDDEEKKDVSHGNVNLNGYLALSLTKDEEKEFTNAWKNKEVPKEKVIPLYNFILRKCSVKAIQIQEELNLPSHLPLPQVKDVQEQKS
tara:strand:- start:1322 stop:1753 length:432 start_codon:yes stop_codon:yes gene_type:complete